jgi:hypothetical protein
MTTNQKVLAGLGLAAVAYLGYRYSKKGSIFGKSNMSGDYYESLRNLPEQYVSDREAMSNATGTMCRCDNGFTGRCESGDCDKCCGSYNKQKPEQRRYKF